MAAFHRISFQRIWEPKNDIIFNCNGFTFYVCRTHTPSQCTALCCNSPLHAEIMHPRETLILSGSITRSERTVRWQKKEHKSVYMHRRFCQEHSLWWTVDWWGRAGCGAPPPTVGGINRKEGQRKKRGRAAPSQSTSMMPCKLDPHAFSAERTAFNCIIPF